jgi:hypothetical protein
MAFDQRSAGPGLWTRDKASALGPMIASIGFVGAGATMLAGLLMLAVRLQPDTGHGEDIGGGLALVILTILMCIFACLGFGAGIARLSLAVGRRKRLWSSVSLGLTLTGVACAVVSWLI